MSLDLANLRADLTDLIDRLKHEAHALLDKIEHQAADDAATIGDDINNPQHTPEPTPNLAPAEPAPTDATPVTAQPGTTPNTPAT